MTHPSMQDCPIPVVPARVFDAFMMTADDVYDCFEFFTRDDELGLVAFNRESGQIICLWVDL